MAYYSGTASSLADLRTALLTHAAADGWTLTGDVLSKAGVFFQIQVNADNITCLGCESNAVANPAPGVVMIGKIYATFGQTTRLISFPCNYEVFGFAQELYLVVNYDVDSYQWMAFGKSTVPGLPGQGGWCGATIGSTIPNGNASGVYAPISLQQSSITALSQGISGMTSGQLFVTNQNATYNLASYRNSWVNSGLDSNGWWFDVTNAAAPSVGILPMLQLLWQQPSVWNTEASLLPLRAWKRRASYKISLTVDLANARMIRIDNLAPGDLLTIGSDQWKVFPWYRKDVSARNGATSANHSGTFGWAIRYEGP